MLGKGEYKKIADDMVSKVSSGVSLTRAAAHKEQVAPVTVGLSDAQIAAPIELPGTPVPAPEPLVLVPVDPAITAGMQATEAEPPLQVPTVHTAPPTQDPVTEAAQRAVASLMPS